MTESKSFAPYCGDTIGANASIRPPTEYGGHLWICVSSGPYPYNEQFPRSDTVYRVVPLDQYVSPHPDLPLPHKKHVALSNDHPFRYSYEGVIVTLKRQQYVLTDEHLVPSHPYGPDPECLRGECSACRSVAGYAAMTPQERLAAKRHHHAPVAGFDPHAHPPKRTSRNPYYQTGEIIAPAQMSLL